MGETIVSLAGTQAGELFALVLTLMSALAHAIFGAVNKGGEDPYLNRGAINVIFSIMAAPFALFVLPWPDPFVFQVLLISALFHMAYEWLQAAAYSQGEFTLVYPIARGVSPLITAVIAIFLFQETLGKSQWFGIILLSASILSLAAINIQESKATKSLSGTLMIPIVYALGAGVFIALYTTTDAYGIRLPENPFTFLIWYFFLGGFFFPVVAGVRWYRLETKPDLNPLFLRGLFGALIAFFSFGSLMLATRVGKVSEVAALRETSIIFATGIGVLFFHEKVNAKKLFAILLIVLGAILIEFH